MLVKRQTLTSDDCVFAASFVEQHGFYSMFHNIFSEYIAYNVASRWKLVRNPLGQPWLPIWGKPSWQLKGHIATFTSYLRRKRLTFLLELTWQETMPRKEASSCALGVTSNVSFSFVSHWLKPCRPPAELRTWNDDRGVSEPRFQLPAAIVFRFSHGAFLLIEKLTFGKGKVPEGATWEILGYELLRSSEGREFQVVCSIEMTDVLSWQNKKPNIRIHFPIKEPSKWWLLVQEAAKGFK